MDAISPANPPEQCPHLTRVVSSVVGQHADDNLAGTGINADVELPPEPAGASMLLFIPLALAKQLEAGAIDHQVQRAVWNGRGPASDKAAATAAERGVVWNAQLLPNQPK